MTPCTRVPTSIHPLMNSPNEYAVAKIDKPSVHLCKFGDNEAHHKYRQRPKVEQSIDKVTSETFLSKVNKFFIKTCPPKPNYQLNFCESLGNSLLIPAANVVGTLSIKAQKGESLLKQRVFALLLGIISLPLTILGCIFKGIGQAYPHKKITATDETANLSLTPQQRIDECYKQAAILSEVCIQNGFAHNGVPKFMIGGGTALGAERHKGMIPWDDDIDVFIFDEEGFLALKDKLKEAGLELLTFYRFQSIHKLRFTLEKFKELYPDANYADSAELDAFVFAKMSDGSYTYDRTHSRANYPDDFVTAEEFEEGFEMKPFGNMHLPGLKSQATYLKRFFGTNCLTHGLATHGHIKVLGIVIPVQKSGAHYYEIQKYKNCALPRAYTEIT